MNRSHYLERKIDKKDHAILAALFADGRITTKDLADLMDMSSPSAAARILKMKDAGAIKGYTVVIDPLVFGLSITANLRMSPFSGEVNRLKQMLNETPQIVEANHVSGKNGYVAIVMTCDTDELNSVIACFSAFASIDSEVILSPTVPRRLPKF